MSRFTDSIRGRVTGRTAVRMDHPPLGVVMSDHYWDTCPSSSRLTTVLRFHAGVTIELDVDDSVHKEARMYAYEEAIIRINDFVYGDINDALRELRDRLWQSDRVTPEIMEDFNRVFKLMR